MKRLLSLSLVIFALCPLLSGCFDKREIDDMTYAIALGLDKGTTNELRLTVQYAVPIATGANGGGGEPGKSVQNITLECPGLWSGINMANNFVGKEINLSHAKVIVFSEELAASGKMTGYIRGLLRSRDIRPNIYIAVSKGPAGDYLKSIKPTQEADPAKYYELKFSAYRYTGFTAGTGLHDFHLESVSPAQQAVAPLVGVSSYKSPEDFKSNASTYTRKGRPRPLEGDYTAGNLPKIGDIEGESMGLAVFGGEKMVGELDGEEASYYLIATGNYNHSFWTVPDPETDKWYVVINLKQSRTPSYRVDIINGKPHIILNVILEGDFLAIQSNFNYESEDRVDIFNKSMQSFLHEGLTRFLNRTRELNSDVCGFGRYAKGNFLTENDWLSYGWPNRYRDATFDVNVDFKIRRPGLLLRQAPIEGASTW